MDRIVFPSNLCPKCKGELTFCWLSDYEGHKHFRIWCEPCNSCFPRSVTKKEKSQYKLADMDLPRYLTLAERGLKEPRSTKDYQELSMKDTPETLRLRAMPYSEYLKSDHWKAMREKMLHKAKYCCQLCSGKLRLNVHHRTYERKGREWKSDLIVLCRDCHAKFHDKLP